MKKDRKVRWNSKLQLFVFFLLFVVGIQMSGELSVNAATSDKYHVGETYLDMDGITEDESGRWIWDGETKTLQFAEEGANIIDYSGDLESVLYLPADSTIVVNAQVAVKDLERKALICDGNLTIVGEGRLRLEGYDERTAVRCYGKVIIGDGQDLPYVEMWNMYSSNNIFGWDNLYNDDTITDEEYYELRELPGSEWEYKRLETVLEVTPDENGVALQIESGTLILEPWNFCNIALDCGISRIQLNPEQYCSLQIHAYAQYRLSRGAKVYKGEEIVEPIGFDGIDYYFTTEENLEDYYTVIYDDCCQDNYESNSYNWFEAGTVLNLTMAPYQLSFDEGNKPTADVMVIGRSTEKNASTVMRSLMVNENWTYLYPVYQFVAPNKENVTSNQSEDGTKIILKGIETYQEYSQDGETWTAGTGEDVAFDMNSPIFVRNAEQTLLCKRGDEEIRALASEPLVFFEITSPALDYKKDVITGLDADSVYVITDEKGKETEITSDQNGNIPLEPYYGKNISIVKKSLDEVSQPHTLTVAAQEDAPSRTLFTLIEPVDQTPAVIKNITDAYEYSVDNGKTWKNGDGKDIQLAAESTIWIRKPVSDTAPASKCLMIKIPVATITPPPTPETNPPQQNTIEEEIINSVDWDKQDLSGSEFRKLQLKATGKKKSVSLKWKKIKNADGYIIFGSKCGKELKKITEVSAKKIGWTNKNLKKGTYYKYIVVAYENTETGSEILTVSKTVHAVTLQGKRGNQTKITVKQPNISLKKGRTAKIKATAKVSKKVNYHIAQFRYESSNAKVATVTGKGVVKGKKKGKAVIYVIGQNGCFTKVKVTVK